MKQCSRCGRNHGGVCCIPPFSTMRSPGLARGIRETAFELKGKPSAKKSLSRGTLEGLLEWGKREEVKLKEVLKALPYELPEYNEAMTRLDKLQNTISIIIKQIAGRKD